MESIIRYRQVIFLLTLLIGTVATVSAAGPVVIISSDDPFDCNGLEISEVSFLDLIDPETTRTTLESTDEGDQAVLTGPAIRYISRDCPEETIGSDGYTITSRSMATIDWTGINRYPVYIKPVIPAISATVPGETGNVVLIRIVSGTPDAANARLIDLFEATDTMYLYHEGGIVHVNPQTRAYTLWGDADEIGYDPHDFEKSLTNTQVDLGGFTVDPALAREMARVHPDTVPPPGEYLCGIFRYDPNTSAVKVLGMAPVFILHTDRALTWNGGEIPDTYTGENDVTLGFEDGESIDGMVYFIFRKDTVFDAEMTVNLENALAMRDHPLITPTSLIGFLLQKVPGHTRADSPVECTLIADKDTVRPDDLTAPIPISTGYGISGVGEGQEVTVPASALSGLKEGTYLVTLCGAGEDGSVLAVDQKEIVIGSGAPPGKPYDNDGGDDWYAAISSNEGRAGVDEEVTDIETMIPRSGENRSKNSGGAAAIKDVRIGEGYPEDPEPTEPAGDIPGVLGYASIGLIALLLVGIVLRRGGSR